MNKKLINVFYNSFPAVISTRNSYIAAANPAAISRIEHFSEGQYLFDIMEPSDVLKFQACFEAAPFSAPFSFPLCGFYGYKWATAVFELIMGRRFAIVFLSREKEADMLKFTDAVNAVNSAEPLSTDSISAEFLSLLLGIPEIIFDPADKTGLFDIHKIFFEIVNRLYEKKDRFACKIRVVENEGMKESSPLLSLMPLQNFIGAVLLILWGIRDISTDRNINVKLCRFGSDTELRFSVNTYNLTSGIRNLEELMEAFPSSTSFFSIADYIAGISQSSVSVLCDKENNLLTLSLIIGSREFDDVDFKSRDPLKYFNSDYCFVADKIEKLFLKYREEEQA